MSSVVVAQLLYLEAQSVDKPICMYINSPGGVVRPLRLARVAARPSNRPVLTTAQVTAGLAIYDTMQYIAPPVATLCVGQACSMGSLLLAAGAPGMRRSLPNARIMMHQPSGGVSGQVIGPPGAIAENSARRAPVIYQDTKSKPPLSGIFALRAPASHILQPRVERGRADARRQGRWVLGSAPREAEAVSR